MGVRRGDFVSKAISSTSETDVGDITVPKGVRKIVGIWTNFVMTPTASKSQFGTVRLTGDGLAEETKALKFPLNAAVAYASSLANDQTPTPTYIIPVDIPVTPNYTITPKVTMNDATSTTVWVGLLFE